jgi:hypothetical protein
MMVSGISRGQGPKPGAASAVSTMNHASTTNQSSTTSQAPATSTAQQTAKPGSATAKDSARKNEVHIGNKLQRTINRFVPYYVFIFLGGFVLLAVIRILDPPYLRNLIVSSINLKLLLNLFKEGIFGFNVTNLLLDVLCICMFSICIQVYFFPAHPQYFVWILAFTGITYFLKLIVIQFLANIFMGRAEALIHLLMHLLFTRLLGLVLLPVLFAGLYQPIIDVTVLLHVIVVSVFVLYLGWLMRLYVQMKSMSSSGIFYLFLYLCTIELSPLAILLKDYVR